MGDSPCEVVQDIFHWHYVISRRVGFCQWSLNKDVYTQTYPSLKHLKVARPSPGVSMTTSWCIQIWIVSSWNPRPDFMVTYVSGFWPDTKLLMFFFWIIDFGSKGFEIQPLQSGELYNRFAPNKPENYIYYIMFNSNKLMVLFRNYIKTSAFSWNFDKVH